MASSTTRLASPNRLKQYKASGVRGLHLAGAAVALPAYAAYKTAKETLDFSKKVPGMMKDAPMLHYAPEKYMAKHGEAAFAAVGTLTGGSFLAKPRASTLRMGFPNIEDPKIRASIRKALATEFKSRGKLVKDESVEGLVDYVTRGPWFHGRGTYPEPGQSFAGARRKIGNLGEPTGISMTGHPNVTTGFTKGSIPETEEEVLSRVTPLIKGDPKQKILPGWKAPDTKKYQKTLSESYQKAAEQIMAVVPSNEGSLVKKYLGIVENATLDKDQKAGVMKEILTSYKEHFNRLLTLDLQRKGYKGILYSPQRYGEYELKMFDPADTLMMEKRKVSDKGIARLMGGHNKSLGMAGRQSKRLRDWSMRGNTMDEDAHAEASLGDIYSEYIDLADLYDRTVGR